MQKYGIAIEKHEENTKVYKQEISLIFFLYLFLYYVLKYHSIAVSDVKISLLHIIICSFSCKFLPLCLWIFCYIIFHAICDCFGTTGKIIDLAICGELLISTDVAVY